MLKKEEKYIRILFRKLSTKYNIPEKEIEVIVNSQFKFVKNVIESAEKDNIPTFKSINLKHLGKFVPNKKMIAHIINYKSKKENNGDRSNQSV